MSLRTLSVVFSFAFASLVSATTVFAQAAQIPTGHYVCWHFSTPLPLLNFDIKGSGRYTDAEGKSGTYADAGGGLIAFSGGNFDGQTARFRSGNPPTIAFQGTGGRETETCQPGRD